MLTKSFISAVSALSGIPERKLYEYARSDDVLHVLERPYALDLTACQIQKIDQINILLNACQSLRVLRESDTNSISDAKFACEFFRSKLSYKVDSEIFMVAFLDAKSHIISFLDFSTGLVDAAVVPISKIIKRAIQLDSKYLILAHNHPSLDCEPSKADKEVTHRFVQALQLFDMQLLDHIIIGGSSFTSMAALGFVK